MAARLELQSPPHFKAVGPGKSLYAEKSQLSDAYSRLGIGSSYSAPNWLEDTVIWLVVYESDTQITPPLQKTPNPTFHGCSYVLINAVGGFGGQVGGGECEKFSKTQNNY
jgi:hypothetical protein